MCYLEIVFSLIRLTIKREGKKWSRSGKKEYKLVTVASKLIIILPLMQTDNCFVKDHELHINFLYIFPLAALFGLAFFAFCSLFNAGHFFSLVPLSFFFIERFFYYFLQSCAGGKHPRRHLLLRKWYIPHAPLSGAVQLTGPSYPCCRDSFPVVAPQLIRL